MGVAGRAVQVGKGVTVNWEVGEAGAGPGVWVVKTVTLGVGVAAAGVKETVIAVRSGATA